MLSIKHQNQLMALTSVLFYSHKWNCAFDLDMEGVIECIPLLCMVTYISILANFRHGYNLNVFCFNFALFSYIWNVMGFPDHDTWASSAVLVAAAPSTKHIRRKLWAAAAAASTVMLLALPIITLQSLEEAWCENRLEIVVLGRTSLCLRWSLPICRENITLTHCTAWISIAYSISLSL